VLEIEDISLNYDTGYTRVMAPSGKLMKQFSIINPAVEADAIVVVSKSKTHPLTYLSGAAKICSESYLVWINQFATENSAVRSIFGKYWST
jgi:hypothetical protein